MVPLQPCPRRAEGSCWHLQVAVTLPRCWCSCCRFCVVLVLDHLYAVFSFYSWAYSWYFLQFLCCSCCACWRSSFSVAGANVLVIDALLMSFVMLVLLSLLFLSLSMTFEPHDMLYPLAINHSSNGASHVWSCWGSRSFSFFDGGPVLPAASQGPMWKGTVQNG